MKDNINIEELFKSKFDNFEGNVDPSAWANIQQGINAAAVWGTVATGLSGIAKVAIIVGVVSVTAVSAWYFSGDKDFVMIGIRNRSTCFRLVKGLRICRWGGGIFCMLTRKARGFFPGATRPLDRRVMSKLGTRSLERKRC